MTRPITTVTAIVEDAILIDDEDLVAEGATIPLPAPGSDPERIRSAKDLPAADSQRPTTAREVGLQRSLLDLLNTERVGFEPTEGFP